MEAKRLTVSTGLWWLGWLAPNRQQTLARLSVTAPNVRPILAPRCIREQPTLPQMRLGGVDVLVSSMPNPPWFLVAKAGSFSLRKDRALPVCSRCYEPPSTSAGR
jgi:hypothetical protein